MAHTKSLSVSGSRLAYVKAVTFIAAFKPKLIAVESLQVMTLNSKHWQCQCQAWVLEEGDVRQTSSLNTVEHTNQAWFECFYHACIGLLSFPSLFLCSHFYSICVPHSHSFLHSSHLVTLSFLPYEPLIFNSLLAFLDSSLLSSLLLFACSPSFYVYVYTPFNLLFTFLAPSPFFPLIPSRFPVLIPPSASYHCILWALMTLPWQVPEQRLC